MSPPRVFVSYATEDATVANSLVGALEAAGIHCWMAPRNIVPGEEWGAAIIRALNDARVVVFVLSEHSNTSASCLSELERARNRGLRVIPFRLSEIQLAPGLEFHLSTAHWLDAFPPPIDRMRDHLVKVVDAFLRDEPAPKLPTSPPKRLKRALIRTAQGAGVLIMLLFLWSLRPPGKGGDNGTHTGGNGGGGTSTHTGGKATLTGGGGLVVKPTLQDLRERLALDPNNISLRMQIAKIYVTRGDYDEARKQYQGILDINPDHSGAKTGLANLP